MNFDARHPVLFLNEALNTTSVVVGEVEIINCKQNVKKFVAVLLKKAIRNLNLENSNTTLKAFE